MMSFSPDTHNLAARIMAAVLYDETTGGGCDIASGMMGPALSTLVDDIAFALRDSCPTYTADRFLSEYKDDCYAQ